MKQSGARLGTDVAKRVRKVFPRNIGFRGNHDHGRPLGDPVFPTKSVAKALQPKGLCDWRSTGRMLLMATLARIEGFRLRSTKACMVYQSQGFCHPMCAHTCAKAPTRVLCGWKAKDTVWQHYTAMDGLLNCFKGKVETTKPLFSVERRVAKTNMYKSVKWVWQNNRFVSSLPKMHPAFNLDFAKTHSDGNTDEQIEYQPKTFFQNESNVFGSANLFVI